MYHWIGKSMWQKSVFLCKALDFSDDEKEKEAKQRKKSQVQGRKKFKSELNESGKQVQYIVIFNFHLCLYKFISNKTEGNV